MTDLYNWPPGKRAAAIVSIDFDGPSPFLWSNPNSELTTIGELELRRFGPRQGIHRLLELFDSLNLHVSAYIPGAICASQPNTVATILEHGHEVALHGYMHENVTQLGNDQLKEVLEKSSQALEAVGAAGPFGYRSPSWELTTAALNALENHGVLYDSSLMGYDRPYWISNLVEIPVQWPLDDAIFYRYIPGSHWPPVNPQQLISGWKLELEGAKRYGSLFTLTMHPWLSGRAGRMLALAEFLEQFRNDDEIWWTTSNEVALHHKAMHGDDPHELPRLGEI